VDHQIHVDPEPAAKGVPYGITVAHGNPILSLLDFLPLQNRSNSAGSNSRPRAPTRVVASLRSSLRHFEALPGELRFAARTHGSLGRFADYNDLGLSRGAAGSLSFPRSRRAAGVGRSFVHPRFRYASVGGFEGPVWVAVLRDDWVLPTTDRCWGDLALRSDG
jgi:hypothetical protein